MATFCQCSRGFSSWWHYFSHKTANAEKNFFFLFLGCFLPRPLHSAHSITWKLHSLCWNRPWLCSQSCGCSPVRINTEQRRILFLPDTVAVLHHWGGPAYWSWAHGAESWDSRVSARGWTWRPEIRDPLGTHKFCDPVSTSRHRSTIP